MIATMATTIRGSIGVKGVARGGQASGNTP